MAHSDLGTLSELIRKEREVLLGQWREQVKALPSASRLDTPTLNDHIPGLLEELATAMSTGSDETIAEALLDGTPPTHGEQRYRDGFDIEEVVAEYNILRGCIHDLADRHGLRLQGAPFHVMNRVLDGAIGSAVKAFAVQRAAEVLKRREEHLAFVAHDLRTPLNAIALAMSAVEYSPTERSSNAAKILRRNLQRLEGLVTNILKDNVDLDAEAALKLEQRLVDLWPLAESVRIELGPLADSSGTRLANTIPEDLQVFADASMVTRVFQNLVANAVAHTPAGEVVIGARTVDEGMIECSVKDNGVGIRADRLGSVFEKMENRPGRGAASGMGLGLAIVKAFVEAHGGEVGVQSQEGRGAWFRFTLPATEAHSIAHMKR
jgi:two-component system, OmpR family, phosphate regulon sensor histidine kinase PhoR